MMLAYLLNAIRRDAVYWGNEAAASNSLALDRKSLFHSTLQGSLTLRRVRAQVRKP